MDTDENLYFDGFEKKSLSEIQELFQNLKHIGMSEKDIDKYALAYKEFFEKRVKATEEIKIYNTSIPWREKLMERAEIKKTLRDELINLKKDEN